MTGAGRGAVCLPSSGQCPRPGPDGRQRGRVRAARNRGRRSGLDASPSSSSSLRRAGRRRRRVMGSARRSPAASSSSLASCSGSAGPPASPPVRLRVLAAVLVLVGPDLRALRGGDLEDHGRRGHLDADHGPRRGRGRGRGGHRRRRRGLRAGGVDGHLHRGVVAASPRGRPTAPPELRHRRRRRGATEPDPPASPAAGGAEKAWPAASPKPSGSSPATSPSERRAASSGAPPPFDPRRRGPRPSSLATSSLPVGWSGAIGSTSASLSTATPTTPAASAAPTGIGEVNGMRSSERRLGTASSGWTPTSRGPRRARTAAR